MKIIVDLHIHSKYSRATSLSGDLKHIAESAKTKGIDVVATGDFTHPAWLDQIEKELKPAEPGLFKYNETRFILSTEISCIYSKNNKVRKIHIVVLAPDIKAVKKINSKLSEIGNLTSDGRPILGLDAKNLLEIILEADKNCLFIPAHVLTPWFGLFGSKSGFDSVKECFEDLSHHIYALETGLSADPSMIWRIPDGRKLTLVSNSDAHSPQKLGREANVFDIEMSYNSIIEAIKTRKGFLYTIEFYPQEGKYHYDGHRSCDICLSSEESKKYNNVCPACGKPLTLGVAHRVAEIADKEKGFIPENKIPFKSLVPLKEIISEAFDCGVNTKKVNQEYDRMISSIGNEFYILLEAEKEKISNPAIREGIEKARKGQLIIEPGYDGVFGKVKIFSKKEKKKLAAQKVLFD